MKNVLIRNYFDALQIFKGLRKVLEKDTVLKLFDFAEILKSFRIPEITSRFKVAKNIKHY